MFGHRPGRRHLLLLRAVLRHGIGLPSECQHRHPNLVSVRGDDELASHCSLIAAAPIPDFRGGGGWHSTKRGPPFGVQRPTFLRATDEGVHLRASLLAADRALAARVVTQPFASAIPDAMTGNAVLVWPAAAVVRGPATVRRLLNAQPGLAGARISWQPLHVEVAADGSLGLIWGVIALDRDTGEPPGRRPRVWGAFWRPGGGRAPTGNSRRWRSLASFRGPSHAGWTGSGRGDLPPRGGPGPPGGSAGPAPALARRP